MVNAASDPCTQYGADNAVIAGAFAPFGGNIRGPGSEGPRNGSHRFGSCAGSSACPLEQAEAGVPQTSQFDVWSHHPYTYGAQRTGRSIPTTYRSVTSGDALPLEGRSSAGHIKTRGDVGFWVTEFS